MAKAMRVCPCVGCPAHDGGCPEVIPRSQRRCAGCGAEVERARGSRQQRGYNRQHELIREQLLRAYVPGTPCPVCDQPMLPGQALDAGHSVDLRDNPNAKADRLEHASCNRGWRRGTSR